MTEEHYARELSQSPSVAVWRVVCWIGWGLKIAGIVGGLLYLARIFRS